MNEIFGVILISCSLLMVGYGIYQLFRNEKVFKIRMKWIETQDTRWHYFPYEYMLHPKKNNWFGFRFPKDEHYCIPNKE